MLPHPTRRRASSTSIALVLLSLAALACGGGGSGGGSGGSVQTGTGSVAVLLTDGPVDPDAFSHIYVSFTKITLIGPAGSVVIFEGNETIDLRELEDASTLVTLGRDVPSATYEKIRLDVASIELVPADGGSHIFPKLPPKIDLNPRGSFHVRPGELLLVQIDVDCGKSIHIVGQGNGGYQFRPVIFADILTGPLHGKLVLLRGTVKEIGSADFLLCDTHPVSQSLGAARTMTSRGDDDDDHGEDGDGRDDFCSTVDVVSDTSLFDENGDPIELADLQPDDTAWVLGRFVRDGDEDLDFEAEVVQQGDDIEALDGEVASEVGADDRFDLELDAGQGIIVPGNLLAIQLQEGTKVFRRDGQELLPDDITPGDPARAVGVLALSTTEEDVLKAAWVVLDIAALGLQRIEGEIESVANGGARIQVQTDTGTKCVNVPSDARVFEVHHGDTGASAEDIDRSALQAGDEVNVFGTAGGTCFTADTVIVFVED
jgi:hypothetical protein